MVLFTSLAAAAALAGSSYATPLFRRQGGSSGLPANATIPEGSGDNVTYTPVPSSQNGSSYLNATVESVPLGVNASGWNVSYTNSSEPYENAHIFIGNPTKNGTNTSMAWPGQPAGGLLQYKPTYTVESNFDFQSLNLALNQELIELDLFHNGLARFSVEDFEAAGLTADDRALIEHMANQEIGHAVAITNVRESSLWHADNGRAPAGGWRAAVSRRPRLDGTLTSLLPFPLPPQMLGVDRAAKQCLYQYPFSTVQQFILFCQLLTRWGEAGVYGFLGQLDSRPAAQILLQSITTEARQQLVFRQFQVRCSRPPAAPRDHLALPGGCLALLTFRLTRHAHRDSLRCQNSSRLDCRRPTRGPSCRRCVSS